MDNEVLRWVREEQPAESCDPSFTGATGVSLSGVSQPFARQPQRHVLTQRKRGQSAAAGAACDPGLGKGGGKCVLPKLVDLVSQWPPVQLTGGSPQCCPAPATAQTHSEPGAEPLLLTRVSQQRQGFFHAV